MELKEIKEVIRLMKVNDLTDFELEKEGFKIILRKEGPAKETPIINQAPPAYFMQPTAPSIMHQQAQAPTQTVPVTPEKKEETNVEYIVSPMVGTFYAAASPESPPYVQKGQHITDNDVVCIVEAMKVFNEINAEISGTIADILVENGSPVEFGQKLFKVKKA